MADQGKNTGADQAVGWFIIGMVLLCCFWLFWHLHQQDVKSLYRWIRYGEIWLISQFVSKDYTVPYQGGVLNLHQWKAFIPQIPKERLDGELLAQISVLAMYPLRWFFMVVMGCFGIWAYEYGPGTQFRRKLDIHGLIGVQSRVFPVIAPFVKFNPGTQPPRPPGSPVPAELPLFAEALAPEEWIAYHHIPMPDGKPDEGAAYIAFAKQLGPRWQGAMKLAPYKQILLAAFVLKAARKRDDSDEMLGRIARCWSFEKGLELGKDRKLLADARKVLRSKDLAEKTLGKCNYHAFETTALIKALLTAREEGGVLAPAQFVWLRGYDRTLWYPLNNLGRQAYHIEALGAMSHFKAERLARRPIPKPKLDGALRKLAELTASPRARAIPQVDYKNSKKKPVKQPAKKKK
jgi:intracellular multiplication protein IcmP